MVSGRVQGAVSVRRTGESGHAGSLAETASARPARTCVHAEHQNPWLHFGKSSEGSIMGRGARCALHCKSFHPKFLPGACIISYHNFS